MFKRFFILNRDAETYDFFFPFNLCHNQVIEKPFLFPCQDFERYEHGIYVVVLTEISGNKNFITARFIKENNIAIAFESDHPWFELIYSIMNNVIKYKLYLNKNWKSLEKYLTDLLILPHPEPGVVFYIPSADFNASAVKIVVPMKSRQKPFSLFLISLHKQVQLDDWIVIFESLLLERWIIFHSRHLNRVTNCVFAALSLIFPLEWVHLIFPCLSESSINCLGCPSPFVAGIHSCLVEKAMPFLSPGTLLVNIDEGILSFVTPDSDNFWNEEGIPKCLINFLMRNLIDNDLIMSESKKIVNNDEAVRKACRSMVNGFINTMGVLFGKYKSCTQWKPENNRFVIDNTMLAQSRGDVLQTFLIKILQSQMVHQFLDDRVNQYTASKGGKSLTFAVDEIDDFDEACLAMNKWQPDHYTEVFANMASNSRRKITNFAGKMRDIARKSALVVETIGNGEQKYSSQSANFKIWTNMMPTPAMKQQVFLTEKQVIVVDDKQCDNKQYKIEIVEEDITRNKWITFEDDNTNFENRFLCKWNDENQDIIQFDNLIDGDQFHTDNVERKDNVPVEVRDFDPLYHS